MIRAYDPFVRGRFPVGVRTIEAHDTARERVFPCEVWYPAGARAMAAPGAHPLIVFSHHSGGNRRAATYLCTHLASHGYVVAALDHSEIVAPELARREGETEAQRTARIDGWVASRVPDVRFLLDHLLASGVSDAGLGLDPTRVGIVGHSFGGWTALAAPEVEPRIGAVVALAPGGSSRPMPGIIPAGLSFAWGRDVPTLYLAAEDDTPIPLAGVVELFERTPATRRMVVLRRADHLHFIDDVEQAHEAVRATPFSGEAAWIPKQMRPIAELCSGEQSHLFVRGLTLAHLDVSLREREEARCFWLGDLGAELRERGVDGFVASPDKQEVT